MNTVIITALAALFVFGLLITSHELGHFIVAKLNGITVLEFAIGMGPKIYSFKKGETIYTLRLLPIGGYNKMLGEQEKSLDPKAFSNKGPWKRLSVIVAGALMNFLLAIVLFFLVSFNIGIAKPIVSKVDNKYAAAAAGVKVNDRIIGANDKTITSWSSFTSFVAENKDKPFKLTVKRGEVIHTFILKPEYDKEYGKYIIGITSTNAKGDFIGSAKNGFNMMTGSVKEMLGFLSMAFKGKVSSKDVGGPIAIVKLSGEFALKGIWYLLYLTGMLSVNLGLINLIPFPALDGGWVVILLLEGLTGIKINENKLGIINFIGFALLMTLIIFITFNDVSNLSR